MAGHNFATAGNAFEITRLSVEIGLLALALTPIIVTGGIDLSVGSMMGLAAVVLGVLWHDAVCRCPSAIALTLLLGIARRSAERAAHHAARVFRRSSSRSARSRCFAGSPRARRAGSSTTPGSRRRSSSWDRATSAASCRRSSSSWSRRPSARRGGCIARASGRALYAIGHSPEGARYAGIPVARRLSAVYILSGFAASLAAVIYVAHLGQAKSDAGTGYELMAITAVVLGGASIFGGRGTILGTVLGLFSIVLLQNGLRLTGQPAELAGILTGVLLVGTIWSTCSRGGRSRGRRFQPSQRNRTKCGIHK